MDVRPSLAWDVAFTPDVELVMKGKETAVKDVSLALRRAGNLRIDDCWAAAPGHADGHMVIRGGFHEIV